MTRLLLIVGFLFAIGVATGCVPTNAQSKSTSTAKSEQARAQAKNAPTPKASPVSVQTAPKPLQRIPYRPGALAVVKVHAASALPYPTEAFVMPLGPPVPNILEPIDPILAIRPIGDRLSVLVGHSFRAIVVPVEPLPALDIRLQVVDVVDRPPTCIEMRRPLAPVGKGHVIVDPDEIDMGIGPERIEMEIDIAPDLIAEIFRPIRRVADLRPGQHQFDLCRQGLQRCHHREGVPGTAHLRQTAQF